MIVIAEDSVRFAHSGPSTPSTSSCYCGTRILRALLPSPREREVPSDISYRVAKRSSDRSSARGPCPQVLQCQSRVAKGSAVGSTAALRHGHLARKPLSGIPAWRRGYLSGLRHGDPAYNHLSGIPAWRRASRPVHDRQLSNALAGLRHGDPAYKHLSGILA